MTLLTVRQTAERLTLSTRKVYNLVAAGSLPHYRMDSIIRIDEADLEDYLADCRVARQPVVQEQVEEPTNRAPKPPPGKTPVKISHLKIGPHQLALLRRGGVGIKDH